MNCLKNTIKLFPQDFSKSIGYEKNVFTLCFFDDFAVAWAIYKN